MGIFKINIKVFLVCAIMGCIGLPTVAQTESAFTPQQKSLVERIERGSEGRIKISIPEDILELIISDSDTKKVISGPVIKPGINKLNGYRIQVFSDGRGSHSLESRAKARGSAIISKFPQYRGQVYTFSSAPNWYTRIGNFQTQEEATKAMLELKRSFPGFASEMRVVRSQIVVIKN